MNIIFALNLIPMIQSVSHQFAHVMAADLLWHVQSCGPMWGLLGHFLAATKQLNEWYFLSVCPSVCLSVCHTFLAATKQLYEWFSPSVRLSVRLSVCLSVRPSVCLSHLFDYVPIILSSWNFQELLPVTKVTSMQKVKVRGQRSRS